MSKLILLRHGQSEWNKKNLFTGWIDIPLSQEGIQEALEAGRMIQNIPIDVIYTSMLIRAIDTATLAMSVHRLGRVAVILHKGEGRLEEWSRCYEPEVEKGFIPVIRAWELNERMYGELQGRDKEKIRQLYGDAQFKLWRRSFDVPPPNGESLKMTAERTLPYFEREILPQLASNKNVFVAAHGNSLRSIVRELDNLSEEEVVHLEIPTGKPMIYEYQHAKFNKIL